MTFIKAVQQFFLRLRRLSGRRRDPLHSGLISDGRVRVITRQGKWKTIMSCHCCEAKRRRRTKACEKLSIHAIVLLIESICFAFFSFVYFFADMQRVQSSWDQNGSLTNGSMRQGTNFHGPVDWKLIMIWNFKWRLKKTIAEIFLLIWWTRKSTDDVQRTVENLTTKTPWDFKNMAK